MKMMDMAWVWTALALFAAVASSALLLLLLHGITKKKKKKKNAPPPGPRELPILGHLHLLGKNPHRDLSKLAKVHGPIMRLRFGFLDHIVISSPRAARLFLETHDLVFASRPPHEAARIISYGQKNLSFARYGPYWRNVRKLVTLELLSHQKISSSRARATKRNELCLLVESLKAKAATVDLTAAVFALVANVSCRMVCGRKYEMREFEGAVREGLQLYGMPNLGDYFPRLGWLDLQGFRRRMKGVVKVFDQFLEKVLVDHERRDHQQCGGEDFVDTMLSLLNSGEADDDELRLNREHVKTILLDMLVASMDTSANVINWTMSELLRHPQVMKKVQHELVTEVGLERMVEESDMKNLNYLEMVIKESLRFHPPGPLLVPHEAMEDCVVDGFHISKGARILVNAWAIGHDPNVWTDPEEFMPERFEGLDIDYRGRNFELIPFGSGRRSCPGLELGITTVKFVAAQLLHSFDWALPDNMSPKELDMTEEFGLALSRAKHLMVVPHYKLRI
ncbi:unnamed protein product [Cuscuta campestris]|uniref:Cytochrome P450 n=1 Tax=Cuscuta campestris TaxID=132261 RepID=A0A484LKU9_9ASTE|nr:unnamed protein product [Cuscuta campestris]